jgi:acetyl esterase/lipase
MHPFHGAPTKVEVALPRELRASAKAKVAEWASKWGLEVSFSARGGGAKLAAGEARIVASPSGLDGPAGPSVSAQLGLAGGSVLSRRFEGRAEFGLYWALHWAAFTSAWPAQELKYGEPADAVGELRLPAVVPPGGRVPVVALFHGGFWREAYQRDVMAGWAVALCRRGFATWNVEYRRLGKSGGGFPQTLQDTEAAVQFVSALAQRAPVDAGRIATLGHSAGGQLALCAARNGARTSEPGWAPRAGTVSAAVSMAGLCDLSAAHDERLGEGAVSEFFSGVETQQWPLSLCCPSRRLPLRIPQLLIHGAGDKTVPMPQSERYRQMAQRAGDRAFIWRLAHAGHLSPLDVQSRLGERLVRRVADWLSAALQLS